MDTSTLKDLARTVQLRIMEKAVAFRRATRGGTVLHTDTGQRVDKPRIKEDGKRVKSLMCAMCMGYIKVGLQYARCDCGQTYHVSCLTRTGYCPECDKRWDGESADSITFLNGEVHASPGTQLLECPSCGRMVDVYCNECQCGAIFIRDNDSFLCPECGGGVDLGTLRCSTCGEVFKDCEIVTCPACDRQFDASQKCQCGAFIGDHCPECGGLLGPEDTSCSTCGCLIDPL